MPFVPPPVDSLVEDEQSSFVPPPLESVVEEEEGKPLVTAPTPEGFVSAVNYANRIMGGIQRTLNSPATAAAAATGRAAIARDQRAQFAQERDDLQRERAVGDTMESAINVTRPVVEGLADPLGSVIKSSIATGKLMAGGSADVLEEVTSRPWYQAPHAVADVLTRDNAKNPNWQAAVADEPLPLQEELAKAKGVFPRVVSAGLGAVETAPPLATGMFLSSIAPQLSPLFFGTLFGVEAYAKTGDPQAAIRAAGLGVALPGIGAGGSEVGASLATRAGIQSNLGQKVVETVGNQVAIQAAAQVANMPDYVNMTPEERKHAALETAFSFLMLSAMEAGKFNPEVPSMVQQRPELMWQLAERSVDKVLESPEYQAEIHEEAARLLSPEAAQFTASRMPTPQGGIVVDPYAPKPVKPPLPRASVPATPAEPERNLSGVAEIRARKARTVEEIQALWPQANLTRAQAQDWQKRAWNGQPAAAPKTEIATWSEAVAVLKARAKGTETKAEIQSLLPEIPGLSREAAAELAEEALGDSWKPGGIAREKGTHEVTPTDTQHTAPPTPQTPKAPTLAEQKEALIRSRIEGGLKEGDVQITISNDPEMPAAGYVQVDEVSGGKNWFSSNPEQMQNLGHDMPGSIELLGLPSGRYTLAQVREMLKQKQTPAAVNGKTVTVYHGEGGSEGAGQGGAWFTTSADRARSFGGKVSSVELPQDVFLKLQGESKAAGRPESDVVLPPEFIKQAKPHEVKETVHDLDASQPHSGGDNSQGTNETLAAWENRMGWNTEGYDVQYFGWSKDNSAQSVRARRKGSSSIWETFDLPAGKSFEEAYKASEQSSHARNKNVYANSLRGMDADLLRSKLESATDPETKALIQAELDRRNPKQKLPQVGEDLVEVEPKPEPPGAERRAIVRRLEELEEINDKGEPVIREDVESFDPEGEAKDLRARLNQLESHLLRGAPLPPKPPVRPWRLSPEGLDTYLEELTNTPEGEAYLRNIYDDLHADGETTPVAQILAWAKEKYREDSQFVQDDFENAPAGSKTKQTPEVKPEAKTEPEAPKPEVVNWVERMKAAKTADEGRAIIREHTGAVEQLMRSLGMEPLAGQVTPTYSVGFSTVKPKEWGKAIKEAKKRDAAKGQELDRLVNEGSLFRADFEKLYKSSVKKFEPVAPPTVTPPDAKPPVVKAPEAKPEPKPEPKPETKLEPVKVAPPGSPEEAYNQGLARYEKAKADTAAAEAYQAMLGDKKLTEDVSAELLKAYQAIVVAKHAEALAGGELGLLRMRRDAAPFRGQKEPKASERIPGKVITEQKKTLIQMVQEAIKSPPSVKKIVFDVPGDGVFTIENTPENLKRFLFKVEKEFPKGTGKVSGPGLKSGKATNAPAVSNPKPEEIGSVLGDTVSTDESREAIQVSYADGTQVVATDGRQLVRVVTDDAPGTLEDPVRLDAKGRETNSKGMKFPNFAQVIPEETSLAVGGADTGQLFHLARQGQVFRDTFGNGDVSASLQLVLNKDRSLGGSMEIKGETFVHNVQEGAKTIGNFNPDYLANVASVARKLGNEKIDIRVGETEDGPSVFRGKNHEHVLMPMKTEGAAAPAKASEFTGLAGKPEHGPLPKGLAPGENPDAMRSTSAGNNYIVRLENGKVTVLRKASGPTYRSRGKEIPSEPTEIASFELSKLPGTKASREKAIAAILKDHAGADGVPHVALKVTEAIKQLLEERAYVVETNAQRAAEVARIKAAKPAKSGKGGGGVAGAISAPGPLLPAAKSAPVADVKGISQIIRDFQKGLNLPIRFGRTPHPRFGGFFAPLRNYILSNKPNQLPTIAHEVGHKLDEMFKFRDLGPMKAELDVLGDPSTPGSHSSWTPSKTIKYKMGEGVAEFVRYWVTNPTHAKIVAPNMFAHYEKILDANMDLGAVMRQAQNDVLTWRTAEKQARLRSSISNGSPTKTPYTFSQLWRDVVDDLQFTKEAGKHAGNLPPSSNFYTLARIVRGNYGMAETFIKHGVIDFNTKAVTMGSSIMDALRPVSGRMADFTDWIVSARARELRAQGKETGLVREDVEFVYDKYKNDADFVKAFEDLKKWNDALLQYAVDAGLVSGSSASRMRAMNLDYVPFHRLMEIGANEVASEAGNGTGRGLNVGTPGSLKPSRGSLRDIINPIETMIANAHALITAAEKNAIHIAMADSHGRADMGRWVEKVGGPKEMIKVPLERIREQLEAAGADLQAVPDDLLMHFFNPSRHAPRGENMIMVKRGDRYEFYRLQKDLYDTFKALDQEQSGKFIRILASQAQLLRAGVTLTPDFATFNALRDTFNTAIISKYSHIPFEATLRGLAAMIGNKKVVAEWAASGGKQSIEAMYFDRAKLQAYMKRRIANDLTPGERALVWMKSPLAALRLFTGTLEEATRIGEYQNAFKALRKAGMSEGDARRQAAFEARDLQDFAKGGAQTKTLRMLTPFWNAAVQGNVRFFTALKERPVSTMIKGLAWITLPKLMEQAMNWDDEDYWDRPQWERDLFWMIPIGKDENSRTKFLRIPMPFEVGMIFGALPGRVLQHWKNSDDQASMTVGKMFRQQMPGVPIPPALVTLGEVMAGPQGYSFWRGRPIVPESLKGEATELQYTEQNSLTAKALGKAIGISPAKIDYAIGATMGGVGKQVVQEGADRVISGVTGEERTARGKGIMGRFISTPAGSQSDAIEKFYQKLKAVREDESRQAAGLPTKGSTARVARLEEISREMTDLRKQARKEPDGPARQRIQLRIVEKAKLGLEISRQ